MRSGALSEREVQSNMLLNYARRLDEALLALAAAYCAFEHEPIFPGSPKANAMVGALKVLIKEGRK